MTEAEKIDFQAEVDGAIAETRTKLFASSFVSAVYGIEEAGQYTQAWEALSGAEITFSLDAYAPNDAEMEMTTDWSRSGAVLSSRLTVFRGAYDAFLYGSPAARGYTLDLPAGHRGMLEMVAHESGHGVMVRNVRMQPPFSRLPNMEALADDWALRVWPRESR